MPARLVIAAILVTALVGGAAMYYLQVYAFYRTLTAEEAGPVTLALKGGAGGQPIPVDNLSAIDSDSSPIRYRACFTVAESLSDLEAAYEAYPDPTPLNAPGWFSCFDAREIGEALESGQARAFLSVKDLRYGIDRVVAVLPDGRGYAWQQINACGAVVFDGEPPPEGCPPVPQGAE